MTGPVETKGNETVHLVCDNCHEELEPKDKPVHRGDRVYCCEACAFDAGRSKDCGGRTDSHNKPIIEQV